MPKYSYLVFCIGLDSCALFSLSNLYWGNNAIFGVDNSSSMHIGNEEKDILVLGKVPKQALDDTVITAEAECSNNFSRAKIKFCLCLNYNKNNSFLFVNTTQIYHFKAKDSIKPYLLCLGNISKDFAAKIKEKTGLNGHAYDFLKIVY